MNDSNALFRTLWRWHFYAGLFVLPFVITLAVSGTAFLFKPQIEGWEERAYRALPTQDAVAPTRQVDAALAAHPGAKLHSYRLPAQAGDAALLGASFAIGAAHRIEPLLNMTFNAFNFDSDTNYGSNRLPSAPRYFVRGEVLYRNVSGFHAGPTFDLIGKRYVDFANNYSVKAYGLLGARAGYTADHWEVYAEGRNLTDRNYVATVVVKDRASAGMEMLYPGAPRSMYFGARYRF